MKQKPTEQDILNTAIAAVERTAGIKLDAKREVKKGNQLIDAEIKLKGQKKAVFAAEIKRWAQHGNFGALVNQIQQLPGKGMLVADYVDPMMADRLRELDIPFIDTIGNAYFNEKPIYVLVKTGKAQANKKNDLPELLKNQKQGGAFNPTALKVVYALMTRETLINAPYREIAGKAEVALGTVGWVMRDLKQAGHLIEVPPKIRRLKNKQQLLDRWVEAYLEKLRPKLKVGVFRVEDEILGGWMDYPINEYGAQWGGEIAAGKMTGYLKPEKAIVYLPKNGGEELFRELLFRKDPGGNMTVYRAFWVRDQNNPQDIFDVVDPIIAYADLIGTGDARNLEAAKLIYQTELNEFIRED